MVNITINKYPIPIIWLDTSALINITKGQLDASKEDKRYSRLADTIYQAVFNLKLICPQTDQMEEITCSFNQVQKTISKLSRGIHFRHGSDIKDIQMKNAMRAYIKKVKSIEINYQDAFEKDPLTELRNNRFIIDAVENKSDRLLQLERERKLKYLSIYNDLKRKQQAKNVSFEKQFQEELTAQWQATLIILNEWMNVCIGLHKPSMEEFSHLIDLNSMVQTWNLLGGNPQGLEGLYRFLHSEEWNATPCNDIPANMYAKLITNSGPIWKGDPKDITHLTTALPYCHYVVCDKKMRNYVRELALDSKYNAKVFSINDVDEIIQSISK